jgi:hypothetical protein
MCVIVPSIAPIMYEMARQVSLPSIASSPLRPGTTVICDSTVIKRLKLFSDSEVFVRNSCEFTTIAAVLETGTCDRSQRSGIETSIR